MHTSNPGLLAILEAKPGKQAALAEFLNTGLALAAREPGTRSWYAFRITATSFGIYDTFFDDDARQEHLSGPLARALEDITGELLAGPPEVRRLDVLAAKP
jgi:quinol monooxygenase YgiN